jgi:hypothetical protein
MFDQEEPTMPMGESIDEQDDLERLLRGLVVSVNPGLSRADLRSENGRVLADDLLREWMRRGRRLTNNVVRIP